MADDEMNAAIRAPVVDFDLFAATTRDSSDIAWREVRERCPVAWTERNGGHWIVSGYEEVATAFRDWEHFSSARTDPKYCAITLGDSLLPLLTPEEIDPPDWYPLRRILAELLSPRASERLRPLVVQWVAHYVDAVIESGRCDFVSDPAALVPRRSRSSGWGSRRATGTGWRRRSTTRPRHSKGSPEFARASAAFPPVLERIREELEDRRRATRRRDDRDRVHEIEGVRIPKEVAESIVFQTVGGGVDTTTSLIGAGVCCTCASSPTIGAGSAKNLSFSRPPPRSSSGSILRPGRMPAPWLPTSSSRAARCGRVTGWC